MYLGYRVSDPRKLCRGLSQLGIQGASGRPISQVARELGVSPSMLRKWETMFNAGPNFFTGC
ncbi:MAG: transposase [Candidatus Dormibacteraceae bacterium]